jgi:hypothetical protein
VKKAYLLAACFLFSTALMAQNGDPSTAAGFAWGQKLQSTVYGAGPSHTWFYSFTVQGRSYCAETTNVDNGVPATLDLDTELVVYGGNATTELAHNDDAVQEPRNALLSRACWIAGVDGLVYVKLIPHTPAVPLSPVMIRFIETTLFCPWFFVAGDYNAFSLLRNTTAGLISGVVVTWRGLNGTVAGSTTVAINPNSTLILNARDFVNPAVFSNGSIEIAHTASPQAIIGSTTTLSGTTGLGFDAPFEQRKTF